MLISYILYSLALLLQDNPDRKIRHFTYNGSEVKTTFSIDSQFYGNYSGSNKGYLLLKEDGTGEYLYDNFGFAPADCPKDTIKMEWGFILDDNDEIVKFKREYGFSYPVLYRSTNKSSWQGCSKKVFLDYILAYRNGQLTVSSSDDWVRSSKD